MVLSNTTARHEWFGRGQRLLHSSVSLHKSWEESAETIRPSKHPKLSAISKSKSNLSTPICMLTPSQSSTWYEDGARNKNYKMPRRKLLALTIFLLFVQTCERVIEDAPAMKHAQHRDATYSQIQNHTSQAMSCPDSNLTILAPICKMRWHDMYFSYSFNL